MTTKSKDELPFYAFTSVISPDTPSVRDAQDNEEDPCCGGGSGAANAPVEGLYFFHSTALAVAKALWLGDMPKRHVGYALTLCGILKTFALPIKEDKCFNEKLNFKISKVFYNYLREAEL